MANESTDAQLVKRVQKGDKGAFDLLVLKYQHKIVNLVMRYVRDSYGNGNFFPSFLIRSHGLSLAQVGIILALVAGIAGAVGTFLGGFLSDRLGTQDKRWYLWVPLLGLAAGTLPYFYVLLGSHTPSVLGTLVFVNVATTLYLGPCIAMSHALVPPAMRAVTSLE